MRDGFYLELIKIHLCKWASENNKPQYNQLINLVVRSYDYGAMPTAAVTMSTLGSLPCGSEVRIFYKHSACRRLANGASGTVADEN